MRLTDNSPFRLVNTLKFLLLVIPVLLLVNNASASQPVCQLSVALNEWQPYQYYRKNGAAAGIQVELLNQIAKRAKCRLVYTPITFAGSLKALEKGSIDITINASVTEARKGYAYFSVPYRKEVFVLYAKKHFIKQCRSQSIQQLIGSGFKLGLQKGSIYGSQITELQSNPVIDKKFIYVDQMTQSIKFINANNLDGIIADPAIISYYMIKDDAKGELQSCKTTVSASPVSLMFSKKSVSQSIVERFNQAILDVQKTNQYRNNWFW